ncbi:hypothetical protein J6590_009433 [Homalodisca vitripennis]|nr:hypothetical protein J6590_009433 [Homalodisca vitripennis]
MGDWELYLRAKQHKQMSHSFSLNRLANRARSDHSDGQTLGQITGGVGCGKVVEVLEFIFQNPKCRYPSIEELLVCDFFRNIDLREMRATSLPILMMQTGSTCENAFTDDSAHVLHDHGYNQTAVISTGIPNSRNSEDKESNDGIHWQTVTGSFKRPRKLVSNGPNI